jgi:hypothetical protein
MIQTATRAPRRLTRAALLPSALDVLEQARSLEAAAPDAQHIVERLASHREILARRAASVALAPTVSAEELRELRDASRRLVAIVGWTTRKLGGPSHMS